MPEISRFLGIVITMFYRDHGPPHFHASYGSFDIEVSIRDGVVTGQFPKRALRHVLEWYDLHKDECLRAGSLQRNGSRSSGFLHWSSV